MPFILYLTNAWAPSPIWHCTHATLECGASCQAVNCGCIGVWHVWPQNEGDSIEWSPPYPANSTIAPFDGRQHRDHQHQPPGRRLPEVDDEPLAGRLRVPHQPAALEPHAERNQQEAEHQQRRHRDEHHERGVGVVEQAEEERDEQGDEAHRAHRRQDDAG